MVLSLNAFPVSISDQNTLVNACKFAYSDDDYRQTIKNNPDFTFRRYNGDSALCFSSSDQFPISGTDESVDLEQDLNLFAFLLKDAVVRFLKTQNRNNPIGFNPIEIVSSKDQDNLLNGLVPADFPFQIYSKYEIDTKIIGGKVHLLIDCSTRTTVSNSIEWFVDKGFPVEGKYVVQIQDDGYRRLAGRIQSIQLPNVTVLNKNGETLEMSASSVYLDASRENFDGYSNFAFQAKSGQFLETVRIKIGEFNGGKNKRDRIEKLKNYLSDKIKLITGQGISVKNAADISRFCYTLDKPAFIFNDNGEANWQEPGLNRFGPYTKRTFDRNAPSICIICRETHKGQIEQFVRKFLNGIPNHKYFSSGLEGKFHVGTCRPEIFTVKDDSPTSYKNAIEEALQKKTQEGRSWGMALIQVKQEFKNLPVEQNPYFIARSIFLTHQIPVQDFTLELLSQNDNSLGYSLNNMALASYAKMGGVPWLLKSSPAISHELVIGIGSASISEGRLSEQSRVMGITTVFSGDGNYIVSNTSKAVSPNEYAGALVNVLDSTIQKVKSKLNWQSGDTIRIVFHASVKKFNKAEIDAVKEVVEKYKAFNIEYAFLKISDHHGMHMFDTQTATKQKGQFAPQRGQVYKISDFENLVYLIGQRELKQKSDGHPRGLILNIHRDSTFKDIKYLTTQLFNFSGHSWRSYFPSPMPVTIMYSDLIAHNLGWLNKLPKWDDTIMLSKIGQTQWFL
jgi:hypothetical protein